MTGPTGVDSTSTANVADRANDAGRRPTRPPEPRIPRPRRIALAAVLVVVLLVALYLLLPKLAGLNQTWGRLRHGDPLWLGAAAGVELLSIAGYIVLFRTVFGRGMRQLGWATSVQIPLAGIAAIRLIAAGGAGALAVTVWALGRAGMEPRVIACRLVANLLVQYSVYLAALLVFGLGLAAGLLPGRGPLLLTLLPALLSLVVAALAISAVLVPADVERRLRRVIAGPRWWRAIMLRAAAIPTAIREGSRTALTLIAAREPGLLGAVFYLSLIHI